MIAAFAMMVLTFHHRITSGISGAYVLVASLVASYGAAVFVNATRITMAMWLAAHSLVASGLSAAEVHRLEGIAVYFAGLVVLYEIACRLERSVGTAKVRS
jgi:exosortase K